MANKLPKNLQAKWAALMKRKRRNLRKHFKEDGWDLDVMGMTSELSMDLLGVDLAMVVWQELEAMGYTVRYDLKKNTFLINVKKKVGKKRGRKKRK